MMQKITFTPYPADITILEGLLSHEPGTTIPVLVREIVGNYCAEKRQAKRLAMPSHHYSTRNGDDYTESE